MTDKQGKRLVEIVIPMAGLSGCDIKDPVVKCEWDEDLPMPPENTQIVGWFNFLGPSNVISVDKNTNKGHLLKYDKNIDNFYWEAA